MAIINICEYIPSKEDAFIFDSNIWVYLFDKTYTPDSYIANSIDNYTEFYKKILNSGAKIFVSAFNIHEISKLFIKNDKKAFNAYYSSTSTNYKLEYRNSESYKNLLLHIKAVNEQILKSAQRIDDFFTEFENDKFFNTGIDFVDEYFSFLSEKLNCKLVTHDKDFKNCPFNIEILSASSKLL